MSPGHLVFIDETGATTNMARRYGRSPRGRASRLDPARSLEETTFVGGLTTRGFIAPYVLDGAMNGHRFRRGSSRCWRRRFGRATSSSWIICPPTSRRGRQAIEARGAELRYLPPYSPDLNPIEQAFAKFKALLRKAAERTVDGLWTTIGKLLDLFPPAECRNFFNNAGYAT